ncbi:gp78-like protein [Phenacoccus solenopsis nudivirus]|nr:gp78-like protein [Phenacoccus solenopsis nudivirus]
MSDDNGKMSLSQSHDNSTDVLDLFPCNDDFYVDKTISEEDDEKTTTATDIDAGKIPDSTNNDDANCINHEKADSYDDVNCNNHEKADSYDDDDENYDENEKIQQICYQSGIYNWNSNNNNDDNNTTRSFNKTRVTRYAKWNVSSSDTVKLNDDDALVAKNDSDEDDAESCYNNEPNVINLNDELNSLLTQSCEARWTNESKIVLVKCYGVLIPINAETTILSNPMQDCIWGTARKRESFHINSIRTFNDYTRKLYNQAKMNTNTGDEYVAYFAAMYSNEINRNIQQHNHHHHNYGYDVGESATMSSSSLQLPEFVFRDHENHMTIPIDASMEYVKPQNDAITVPWSANALFTQQHQSASSSPPMTTTSMTTNNKLYFYKEFAVIIMRNGCFRDAAIHGKRNNIASILDEYDVKTVYVNCDVGSSLDVFISYPYQPFYETLHKRKIVYLRGTLKSTVKTLPYCPNANIYCSLCRCINTAHKHYTLSTIDQQKIYSTNRLLEKFVRTNRVSRVGKCKLRYENCRKKSMPYYRNLKNKKTRQTIADPTRSGKSVNSGNLININIHD